MNDKSFLMFRRSLMISYGFTLFFLLLLLVKLVFLLGGELAITAAR